MVGTTDLDKAYHPYALCVCSNEKTGDFRFVFKGIKNGAERILNFKMEQQSIVCDAAFEISNTFVEVFGDEVIVVMCWFHAKTAMEDHLKLVKEENQKEILEDIVFLHIAATPEIFGNAANLFMLKWKSKEPAYCEYFEKLWLKQHRNWFVGAAAFTPCHNNALEASNRYLKDSNTIRIRHPLPHFLKVMVETVGKWSKDYTIGLRTFANRPSIDLKLWTNSYNWAKANIPTKIIEENQVSVTVEVDAQIVQAKKRDDKEVVLVSESSSFQISAYSSQSSLQTISSQKTTKKRKVVSVLVSKSSSSQKTVKARKLDGGDAVSEASSQSSIHMNSLSNSQQIQNASTASQIVSDANYENFEIYKRSFHKWTVTIAKNQNCLYESRCNCPAFGKEYICKHVVGLSIRLKLVSAPPEARTVPIGQKRKRGRPSKTKPALIIQ